VVEILLANDALRMTRVVALTPRALVSGRIGRDELGEAKNRRLVFCFAMNFVDAGPRRFLAVGRPGFRKVDFHLEAIEFAAKSDAARSARRVAMKAMLARGDYRRLEFKNSFVAQARGIRKIASGAADRSDQTLVRIHANGDLMGQGRHGLVWLASSTSHASRQSGQ
jgi:hypothetical protein